MSTYLRIDLLITYNLVFSCIKENELHSSHFSTSIFVDFFTLFYYTTMVLIIYTAIKILLLLSRIILLFLS